MGWKSGILSEKKIDFAERVYPIMYKLMQIPFLYNTLQRLFSSGLQEIFERHFPDNKNTNKLVLDLGCGPSMSTPAKGARVIGADISLTYVKSFVAETGKDAVFEGIVCSAETLPFPDACFDEIRTMGLFHHIQDEKVCSAVKEMLRCVRKDGRIIVMDNAWPACSVFRKPLAWLLRRLDRGKYVRYEDELGTLIRKSSGREWAKERKEYSFAQLDLLIFELKN